MAVKLVLLDSNIIEDHKSVLFLTQCEAMVVFKKRKVAG